MHNKVVNKIELRPDSKNFFESLLLFFLTQAQTETYDDF